MSNLTTNSIQSQCDLILAHLKSGKTINPLEALNKYGCFRLGARIWDLKKDGYQIDSHLVRAENGKKYAEYSLKVAV